MNCTNLKLLACLLLLHTLGGCNNDDEFTPKEKEIIIARFNDSIVHLRPLWDSTCQMQQPERLRRDIDSLMALRVREIQEKLATRPR
ncbi:MAG: hypothetical protein KA974_00995 [Saprospiraceae bacterium]|nr:hypothetical protein [Saprospiraceae bacterium]MBP7679494.1 hypothetical protein [Saprospiraceae bacterium]